VKGPGVSDLACFLSTSSDVDPRFSARAWSTISEVSEVRGDISGN